MTRRLQQRSFRGRLCGLGLVRRDPLFELNATGGMVAMPVICLPHIIARVSSVRMITYLGLLIAQVCVPSAAVSTTASAQSLNYRTPDSVPPSWTQFAKLVKSRFEQWIAADEEVSRRFRAHFQNRVIDQDEPPETLVVRAWIREDGQIERIAFTQLKDKQANDDLKAILTRGNVGERPPPDMLQPLHLKLSLKG